MKVIDEVIKNEKDTREHFYKCIEISDKLIATSDDQKMIYGLKMIKILKIILM